MDENWTPPDDDSGDEGLDPRERALRYLQQEIQEARRAGDAAREARAHAGLGLMFADQGRLENATQAFRNCLLSARDGGDREGVAWSLFQLGRMHGQSGSIEDGLSFLQESIEEWSGLDHPNGLLQTELLAAQFHAEAGRLPQAIALLQRAVTRAREISEGDTEWRALRAIADIREQQGRWRDSAEAHTQCIRLLADQENLREEATAWLQLGSARFECGQPEEGLEAIDRAYELFGQCEDPRSQASAQMTAASALANAGRVREALERFTIALTLARDHHDDAHAARMCLWAADLMADVGRFPAALDFARQAAELSARLENTGQECQALTTMARIYQTIGRHRDAADRFAEAAEKQGHEGMKHDQSMTIAAWGAALMMAGDIDDGLLRTEEALAAFSALGDERQAAATLMRLASFRERTGDPDGAKRSLRHALSLYDRLHDTSGQENALDALFRAALDDDDLDTARQLGQTRVERARTAGSPRYEIAALWGLAEVARRADLPTDLLTITARILELARDTMDQHTTSDALEARASALLMLGRYEEAIESIAEWFDEAPCPSSEDLLKWSCTRAGACERAGHHQEAFTLWMAHLERLAARGPSDSLALALQSAVRCALKTGDTTAALRLSSWLLEVLENTGGNRKEAVQLRIAALKATRHYGAALLLACRNALHRRPS